MARAKPSMAISSALPTRPNSPVLRDARPLSRPPREPRDLRADRVRLAVQILPHGAEGSLQPSPVPAASPQAYLRRCAFVPPTEVERGSHPRRGPDRRRTRDADRQIVRPFLPYRSSDLRCELILGRRRQRLVAPIRARAECVSARMQCQRMPGAVPQATTRKEAVPERRPRQEQQLKGPEEAAYFPVECESFRSEPLSIRGHIGAGRILPQEAQPQNVAGIRSPPEGRNLVLGTNAKQHGPHRYAAEIESFIRIRHGI